MRIIGLSLLTAAFAAGFSVSASAANCGHGPPAWWNAPKVSYTYSGSSYASTQSHTLSAQRRVSYTAAPQRYRDSYRRW